MSGTTRISPKSTESLQEITNLTGYSKIEAIEIALKFYLHHEKMRQFNESYALLRSDEEAWNEEMEERNILEGTLEDGLEEE
ncbi:MAG: hypothetical protein K940chlam9_00754 [Chlamydiae bacterium]|nr:hypothetical protein [Chlamydiota bacterium]